GNGVARAGRPRRDPDQALALPRRSRPGADPRRVRRPAARARGARRTSAASALLGSRSRRFPGQGVSEAGWRSWASADRVDLLLFGLSPLVSLLSSATPR